MCRGTGVNARRARYAVARDVVADHGVGGAAWLQNLRENPPTDVTRQVDIFRGLYMSKFRDCP
jgi:hypothetical protein